MNSVKPLLHPKVTLRVVHASVPRFVNKFVLKSRLTRLCNCEYHQQRKKIEAQ